MAIPATAPAYHTRQLPHDPRDGWGSDAEREKIQSNNAAFREKMCKQRPEAGW